MKTVKGVKYKVIISHSIVDHVHGADYSIDEIFIPKYNICFNSEGGAFSSLEERADGKNINVPLDLVKSIYEQINIKNNILNFFKHQ